MFERPTYRSLQSKTLLELIDLARDAKNQILGTQKLANSSRWVLSQIGSFKNFYKVMSKVGLDGSELFNFIDNWIRRKTYKPIRMSHNEL